jgi:hypothetical protein
MPDGTVLQYIVSPSLRCFETRHDAVGHAAILGRGWELDPTVVVLEGEYDIARADAIADELEDYGWPAMENAAVGVEGELSHPPATDPRWSGGED